MALRVCIAVVTLAVALDGGGVEAQGNVRGPNAGTQAGDREVRDLVVRINRHRRSIHSAEVRWDDRLARVAQRHSEDMVRRGYFSHMTPEGLDPFARMRQAGIRFRNAAENLAAGQQTGKETFEAWMASPGHRDNLDMFAYNRIGIGLYRGRWTCLLMRPMGPARKRESRAQRPGEVRRPDPRLAALSPAGE